MEGVEAVRYTAFEGHKRIAAGDPAEVALKVKEASDRGGEEPILVFDDATGEQVDFDLRGTPEDVLRRLAPRLESIPEPTTAAPEAPPSRGPGRPKLGVVAREVTLLPRHWEWLSTQPGGASVALRKLVEEARRSHAGKDRLRKAQEAAYRFLSAMAGDFPGFEEATRALFAGNPERFDECISAWPDDVREHARTLARAAFPAPAGA
jgi:hypothetical protein